MLQKFTKRDIFTISLALGFLCTAVFCCRFSQFAKTAQQVRSQTLRLHIKANSDSLYDQQLKLKVRDAILQDAGELLGQSASQKQAWNRAEKALPELEKIAENTLRKNGCSLTVRARLVHMPFTTTAYTGFTLPAGEYDALRLEIGSGSGHNWFCVLYPGLCLPAAKGESLYPDAACQSLVENKPELRFALLEWMEKWRQKLKKDD